MPGVSESTASVLGPVNVDRLKAFARLEDGWENGKGRCLQEASVKSLEQFVRAYDDFCGVEPSLFLNYQGMLELGWEDRDDNAIEVVMGDGRYGFYFEALDEEDSVPAEDLQTLVTRLREQCR